MGIISVAEVNDRKLLRKDKYDQCLLSHDDDTHKVGISWIYRMLLTMIYHVPVKGEGAIIYRIK